MLTVFLVNYFGKQTCAAFLSLPGDCELRIGLLIACGGEVGSIL